MDTSDSPPDYSKYTREQLKKRAEELGLTDADIKKVTGGNLSKNQTYIDAIHAEEAKQSDAVAAIEGGAAAAVEGGAAAAVEEEEGAQIISSVSDSNKDITRILEYSKSSIGVFLEAAVGGYRDIESTTTEDVQTLTLYGNVSYQGRLSPLRHMNNTITLTLLKEDKTTIEVSDIGVSNKQIQGARCTFDVVGASVDVKGAMYYSFGKSSSDITPNFNLKTYCEAEILASEPPSKTLAGYLKKKKVCCINRGFSKGCVIYSRGSPNPNGIWTIDWLLKGTVDPNAEKLNAKIMIDEVKKEMGGEKLNMFQDKTTIDDVKGWDQVTNHMTFLRFKANERLLNNVKKKSKANDLLHRLIEDAKQAPVIYLQYYRTQHTFKLIHAYEKINFERFNPCHPDNKKNNKYKMLGLMRHVDFKKGTWFEASYNLEAPYLSHLYVGWDEKGDPQQEVRVTDPPTDVGRLEYMFSKEIYLDVTYHTDQSKFKGELDAVTADTADTADTPPVKRFRFLRNDKLCNHQFEVLAVDDEGQKITVQRLGSTEPCVIFPKSDFVRRYVTFHPYKQAEAKTPETLTRQTQVSEAMMYVLRRIGTLCTNAGVLDFIRTLGRLNVLNTEDDITALCRQYLAAQAAEVAETRPEAAAIEMVTEGMSNRGMAGMARRPLFDDVMHVDSVDGDSAADDEGYSDSLSVPDDFKRYKHGDTTYMISAGAQYCLSGPSGARHEVNITKLSGDDLEFQVLECETGNLEDVPNTSKMINGILNPHAVDNSKSCNTAEATLSAIKSFFVSTESKTQQEINGGDYSNSLKVKFINGNFHSNPGARVTKQKLDELKVGEISFPKVVCDDAGKRRKQYFSYLGDTIVKDTVTIGDDGVEVATASLNFEALDYATLKELHAVHNPHKSLSRKFLKKRSEYTKWCGDHFKITAGTLSCECDETNSDYLWESIPENRRLVDVKTEFASNYGSSEVRVFKGLEWGVNSTSCVLVTAGEHKYMLSRGKKNNGILI